MLDQTSKRTIFLFIKTVHSACSGSNLERILLIRRPVLSTLTNFPVLRIKGLIRRFDSATDSSRVFRQVVWSLVVLIEGMIRRHRAPDPYRFESATDSSRVFRQVVWSLGRTTLCAVPDQLSRGPAFTAQSGRNHRILALIFIAQTTWFDGVCLRSPNNFRIEYQRRKKRIRIRIFQPKFEYWNFG